MLFVSPWGVTDFLSAVHSTARVGFQFREPHYERDIYEPINSGVNYQDSVRTRTLHLPQCWLKGLNGPCHPRTSEGTGDV